MTAVLLGLIIELLFFILPFLVSPLYNRVIRAILATPKLKLKEGHIVARNKAKLRIFPPDSSRETAYFTIQNLKSALPEVIIEVQIYYALSYNCIF